MREARKSSTSSDAGSSQAGRAPGRSTLTQGLVQRKADDAAKKPAMPTWVEFTPEGKWEPQVVLETLRSQGAGVPAELEAAIEAGPATMGKLCLLLRDRVKATAGADAAKKARCEEIARALTSRATELYLATSRSPLQYTQLAQVAAWWDEFSAAPAVEAAPPEQPVAPAAGGEAAASPSGQTEGEKYREAVAKRLEPFKKGFVDYENDGGLFDEYIKPGSLEGARQATGEAKTPFTTCNTFGGILTSRAAQDAGVKTKTWVDSGATPKVGDQVKTKVDKESSLKKPIPAGSIGKVSAAKDGGFEVWVLGPGVGSYAADEISVGNKPPVVGPALCVPAEAAKMPPGAWIECKPGMTARPRIGDTLIFGVVGGFTHMDLFKESWKEGEDELWATADGGQGEPGRYHDSKDNKDKGLHGGTELKTQGKEAIMRKEGKYDPEKNTVSGKKLHGWVDIEKMVEEDPAHTVSV